MSEQQKIDPALTEQEWLDRGYVSNDISGWTSRPGVDGRARIYIDVRGHPIDSPADFVALIALANAALPPDDPRKLKWEHVRLLRLVADSEADASFGDWSEAKPLRALADALESYLPPEGA